MVRVEVRVDGVSGKICDLVREDDGSIYIEIKIPGQKSKRIAKINEYLDVLNVLAA